MCAGVEKRSQRTSNPSPSFPLSLWISLQRDFPPTVFMKQLVAWAAFAFLHPEGEKEKEKESACCTCMCRSYVTTCPCLTNKHPQYNLLPPAACFIAFLIILCLVYIACEDRHMHNMWFSPGNEEMFHGFKRKHTLQTINVRERKSLETLYIHHCHYLQQPVFLVSYQMPVSGLYIYTAVGQELD